MWALSVFVFSLLTPSYGLSIERRALTPPTNIGNGWEYQGCYIDVGRTINKISTQNGQMTNQQCTAFCLSKGWPYAGTEFGSECYCGDVLAKGGVKATETDCNVPCAGNNAQPCGGPNRLTLYKTDQVKGTVVNPGVNGWTSMGCYSEGTSGRALPFPITTIPSSEMTVAKCTAACKASGYALAGVEYGGECWCGNSITNGGKASQDGCTMQCNGNTAEYCGGPGHLNVYSSGVTTTIPAAATTMQATTISRGSTSVAPAGNPSTSTSKPAAQPTGFPQGWSSQGCWVDGANGRILNYQFPDNNKLTLQSCAKACADLGYTISGTEYSSQCFCGKEIVNGGKKADQESSCNTPCSGNANQMCGGAGRITLYSLGEPKVLQPPKPIQRVGNWAYQGCAEDNINNKRTFFWQLYFPKTMTPAMCLNKCAEYGYMAAGLEYGEECYCGDPGDMSNAGARFVAESQCNVPCAGNASAICGGGGRLSTYFWKGTPFYSWNYTKAGTPEAGKYDFLIGGVCIPLMTSQGINGKVTFLEKWGTGPANSTGAYELDLTQIKNFNAAWRTMHVKTDIFCAAGVTLPDKAGRQLTVGGWSGDSTYGVRLYTPDGSAGVKGKNDWEENVNALKLQEGRWYPSAMVMANGSVLVIGGEKGSNDAPVPTLELLPPTGAKPLYMEWLERTDPNNLYPFVAVLPSGGIFVAYWNEARILDEVTFATKKILPKIPGAVNDPLGGRTYPLEGTAVLLPQKAPYTAPLGVLICGGSTEGVANALDNCVTIEPDAANPKWTLERMPSQRVMPCMAPLPDGTYLILNGAQHGVAGFGLATNPNLNALLYDPSKPVGSRITVMANTTVARMYHSEAITLLDGRVLVSGSDPEDGVNPQEYRIETFTPPYLLKGLPRPTFTLTSTDWKYSQSVTFTLGSAPRNGAITVSLLGSVSSTHGNSMGARTLLPAVSCQGRTCTVTAPPNAYTCPPGWYQFFVLDGGIPAVGVFVRIGGDPAKIGNWPQGNGFTRPGV